MSTPFHIPVNHQNVVGWLAACAYLHENTANRDYLEYDGRVAYIESHPFRRQWSPALKSRIYIYEVAPKEAKGKNCGGRTGRSGGR